MLYLKNYRLPLTIVSKKPTSINYSYLADYLKIRKG